ncbi:MAG: phycobiliprotein lyase [Cyanobacteria bacterium J06635_15]
MSFLSNAAELSTEALAETFFRDTVGDWRSERRYYTLKSGAIQEVISLISVQYLTYGCEELLHLAKLHQFVKLDSLVCGAQVTWESQYPGRSNKPVSGSTMFGIKGDVLYRDRGFATPKPVTAICTFRDPKTMTLYTEYNDSSFEEEVKLIGSQYRTRQSIIKRAGEEQMIGQYLEKRIRHHDGLDLPR